MNQNKKYHLAFLAALILAAGFLILRASQDIPADSDKWQAVFLTDGQVYFGKLRNENSRFALLQNVYYLKFAEELQAGKNLNLIRLGGEAHGPEGNMYIAKDKILFFENLKDNSTVVQAILNNL